MVKKRQVSLMWDKFFAVLTIISVNIFTIIELCEFSGNLLYAGANGQTNVTESDFGTVTLMEIVVRMRILMLNIVTILFNFRWGFFLHMNGIVSILILKVTTYVITESYTGSLFHWKNINTYWKVEVRAVSELDFSAQLMISDANSYALTEIEGRPTVGMYMYKCICLINFYYCTASHFK